MKASIISIYLATFSLAAYAHPHKCAHHHNSGGPVTWEERCGGSKPTHSHVSDAALSADAESHPHNHHVKHGMILFGDATVYASHIVYKSPHNFQVILRFLNHPGIQKIYSETKALYPGQQTVLILDSMDISQIAATKPDLVGTVYREDSQGQRTVVFSSLEIKSENYEVIYFDELPLLLK